MEGKKKDGEEGGKWRKRGGKKEVMRIEDDGEIIGCLSGLYSILHFFPARTHVHAPAHTHTHTHTHTYIRTHTHT